MSSKFFTWTKGDRRGASEALRAGGIVQTHAEHGSNGGDYCAPEKHHLKSIRRPSQLVFQNSPEPISAPDSRTIDSIALHDAAVKSATNLMAVMNDMLRSPPMSAHLFSQTYPPRLKPMHGRPRSRTAPSTPLVEVAAPELVELPGSFSFEQKPPRYQLDGSKTYPPTSQLSQHMQTAGGILRPHSSPQDSSYKLPSKVPGPSNSLSPQHAIDNQFEQAQRCQSAGPWPGGPKARNVQSDCTTVDPPTLTTHHPVYSPFSEQSVNMSSLPGSLSASRTTSTTAVPQSQKPTRQTDLKQTAPQSDTALLDEICRLRRSHELHVQSLKEAHEKELSTERSYIAFLESRKPGIDRNVIQPQDRPPTPTEQHKVSDPSHANKDSTIQRGFTQARNAGDEGSQDKRLEEVVQKARKNEDSLKNSIADLEARLVAANNERLDVLEGYHEACSRIRELSQSRGTSQAERLTGSPARHRRAVSEVSRWMSANNSLEQHERDSQRQLASKDAQIKRLEAAAASSTQAMEGLKHRVAELDDALNNHKRVLADARSDAERYNSLLHNELRRQTRKVVDGSQLATPRVDADACDVVNERMKRMGESTTTLSSTESSQNLEKELDQCIREIISYKADAKTYRKELRKAHAQIQSLQTTNPERPPTPDRDSNASSRSHSSPEVFRSQLSQSNNRQAGNDRPGLGISIFDQYQTPTRTIASATSAALLSPAVPPAHSAVSSPQSRPKTPLSLHKKLPKPPPSSPPRQLPLTPPSSDIKVQRKETLRSLSESIISSYGSRSESSRSGCSSGGTGSVGGMFQVPRTPGGL